MACVRVYPLENWRRSQDAKFFPDWIKGLDVVRDLVRGNPRVRRLETFVAEREIMGRTMLSAMFEVEHLVTATAEGEGGPVEIAQVHYNKFTVYGPMRGSAPPL